MIPGDPLYYAGTDVLINKHDIRDPAAARSAEYKFAAARELQLAESPIKGKFDLEHLQKIHKHVFQDMYEWAGEFRQLDFAKRNPETGYVNKFVPQADIEKKAAELSRFIQEKNELKGLSRFEFTKSITEVYAKLNELHPFREGNGRSTRVFLSQLAKEAGYELDISKIDKDRWNLAAHKALPQYHAREPGVVKPPSVMDMRQIFHEACRPIEAQRTPVEPQQSRTAPIPERAAQVPASAAPAKEAAPAAPARKSPPHAIAFDQLPAREAYQQFPELENAFRVLAKAQEFAKAKFQTQESRVQFMQETKEKISAYLHAGREIQVPQVSRGYER